MNEHGMEIEIEPERYELWAPLLGSPDRRDFLRDLGGGLVVALLLDRTDLAAQERPAARGRRRGFGRPMPQDMAAWLHIGEDGAVTVFTGKVELGQNIRTSLTQAVAEELRLPPARVKLIMADTAQTPFDMGTFGSMTTPVMARQLHRVAAAAREYLLDLAAEQTRTDRGSLRVAEGRIIGPNGMPPLSFAQITHGKRLTKVVPQDIATTPAESWTIAGSSLPKVNGRDFVTGSHRYTSDQTRPGMLFGKVLRPPRFDARLKSVDTRAAETMSGVKVVHEGDFVGVAAPTEQAAERALDAIGADWSSPPSPPKGDLFTYLKTHPSSEQGFGGRSRDVGGSVADGLGAADLRLEATYTIAYIAHAPLEPRAAVAEWADGKLTAWCGTQRPFGVREELMQAFGLPADRVRVIVLDTGSGYGGKHTGEAAVEAARLARATGKPVRVVWTREEEFTWAYFRPAGVIDVKAGARADGTLTAWEFHNYNSGPSALRTPYAVSHRHQEFHPSRSPLRQGSYRALAATANHFARETHMDDLAHLLGRDPLAFRLKNLTDPRLRAVLEAAARRFGWGTLPRAPGHGVGIAGGTEKGSYVATCAEVAVEGDRVRVVRVVTAFECGAVVNPDHLRNQVEGAQIMGLGGALFEEVRLADGKIMNAHFSSYRVPRFADVPALEVVLLDRRDLPSAGAGETPIVAIAPAVGSALFQATGVRRRSLPLAPHGWKGSPGLVRA